MDCLLHLETDLASCDVGNTMRMAVLGWAELTRSFGNLPTDPLVRRCRELTPQPGHQDTLRYGWAAWRTWVGHVQCLCTLFFSNGCFEITLTYNKLYIFKMLNLINFDV